MLLFEKFLPSAKKEHTSIFDKNESFGFFTEVVGFYGINTNEISSLFKSIMDKKAITQSFEDSEIIIMSSFSYSPMFFKSPQYHYILDIEEYKKSNFQSNEIWFLAHNMVEINPDEDPSYIKYEVIYLKKSLINQTEIYLIDNDHVGLKIHDYDIDIELSRSEYNIVETLTQNLDFEQSTKILKRLEEIGFQIN